MSPVALVTGGAKRIGRAIALRLAQAGYGVAIHCQHSRAEATDVEAAITGSGGRAGIFEADLADADALTRLVSDAAAALGPLTLLVNNASVFEADEVQNVAADLWDRHFDINLRAAVFLTRDFARQVPESGEGAVVNIIDQRVWKPTPQFFSYTLSKAALFTATRTMAQALAPRIRVNAVGPGPTLTSPRQSQDDFARQASALPLGHGPTPEDIAEAVAFLAKAQSVTGQMLAVDGGQHLAWQTPDIVGVTE
ncbi:MAG TPA: SDR family oxidoreductase [Beijerinckiaceae bacterium]|nr:SDR family oxidoreductase [Beijerinckiaceae bacterium]